jgi:predicted regulator of Ras-like GTPase activity (Roadblock/LC7/MglB family)
MQQKVTGMSFSKILKESVERVNGAVSAMIVGIDGMTVEEYALEKIINLDELSAEASQMMKDIASASEGLGLGQAREFSIISDLCGIIMQKISDEYYISMIIKPGGNFGKGRFVLRTTVSKIKDEF